MFLLDGAVESMVATMEFDSEVLHEPVNGWQDFLLRLAHRHPEGRPRLPEVLPVGGFPADGGAIAAAPSAQSSLG